MLVDPNGIDHDELVRLAKKRVMISEFDVSKLSSEGYRVLVDDREAKLPSGEVITNCMGFRNTFHLRGSLRYDVFVPCGGRPESIDLGTVGKLIVDGKSIVPYIVEGANLFITQDAKLRLEKAGTILFKDASANKGGVTSSSLEVLASLSFDDKGFEEHMCIRDDGTAPAFYTEYVKQVQETIKTNARLEFEAIWREHQQTGLPRSTLSDTLSVAITKLDEELQDTELWQKKDLRRSVLQDALPKLLLDMIGLDTILERVRHQLTRQSTIQTRLTTTARTGTRELRPSHLRLVPSQPLRLRVRQQPESICVLRFVRSCPTRAGGTGPSLTHFSIACPSVWRDSTTRTLPLTPTEAHPPTAPRHSAPTTRHPKRTARALPAPPHQSAVPAPTIWLPSTVMRHQTACPSETAHPPRPNPRRPTE